MKIKNILTIGMLFLSVLIGNAQEYSRGLVLPDAEQMLELLRIQSQYVNGGEKVYNMTLKSYGDADASRFDLRDIGAVTPVKFQGSCGSCWAFSAQAAIESNHLLRNKETTDLSEQTLVNCVDESSCQGGWYHYAFEMLRQKQDEVPTEQQAPYQGVEMNCSSGNGNSDVMVTNWQMLGMYASKEEIKEALVTHGVLSAALFSNYPEFMNFKGEEPLRGMNYQPDHAISIVGWDDYKEAWLIKNSWGENWGNDGYGWVGYDSHSLSYITWVDVASNDLEPEPEPEPAEDEELIELDFVHVLGSLQKHQELYIDINGQEKVFGMNEKGVKYHNKVYVPKGEHEFMLITKSIISNDGKSSMIFGITKGKIKVTKDRAYKLVYSDRVKKSNVFKLSLAKDDIKID